MSQRDSHKYRRPGLQDEGEDDGSFEGGSQSHNKVGTLHGAENSRARKPLEVNKVYDDEGRQRFHGAWTGGFSAGYYNTVGSKEGWAPAAFTSSRSKRHDRKRQTPEDFMDEEDDPMLGRKLEAKSEYDTLGTKEKNMAKRKLEDELKSSTGSIPGPVPDEFIVPSSNPIGKKLLQSMGWREGQGVGPRVLPEKMKKADKAKLKSKTKTEKVAAVTATGNTQKVPLPSFLQLLYYIFFPSSSFLHRPSFIVLSSLSFLHHPSFIVLPSSFFLPSPTFPDLPKRFLYLPSFIVLPSSSFPHLPSLIFFPPSFILHHLHFIFFPPSSFLRLLASIFFPSFPSLRLSPPKGRSFYAGRRPGKRAARKTAPSKALRQGGVDEGG
jgi:hypothetical protein